MISTNFKYSLLNLLAQRLQQWADFLREKGEAANIKETNPVETPANRSSHEDWWQKTKSKPPQDWFERVSHDAPELLFEMPEFATQPTEAGDKTIAVDIAENETNVTEMSLSKRKDAPNAGRQIQFKEKTVSQSPKFSIKQTLKQAVSPLKFLKPQSKLLRDNKLSGTNAVDLSTATNFTKTNANQIDSNFVHNKSRNTQPRQTSFIKFKRRETESATKSGFVSLKPNKLTNSNKLSSTIVSTQTFKQPKEPEIIARSKKRLSKNQSQNIWRENKGEIPDLSRKVNELTHYNFAVLGRNRLNREQFVILPQSSSEEKILTETDSFLAKEVSPKSNSNFPVSYLQSQEGKWADLPQVAETSNNFELFNQEIEHLRRIEYEQLGGGWNE